MDTLDTFHRAARRRCRRRCRPPNALHRAASPNASSERRRRCARAAPCSSPAPRGSRSRARSGRSWMSPVLASRRRRRGRGANPPTAFRNEEYALRVRDERFESVAAPRGSPTRCGLQALTDRLRSHGASSRTLRAIASCFPGARYRATPKSAKTAATCSPRARQRRKFPATGAKVPALARPGARRQPSRPRRRIRRRPASAVSTRRKDARPSRRRALRRAGPPPSPVTGAGPAGEATARRRSLHGRVRGRACALQTAPVEGGERGRPNAISSQPRSTRSDRRVGIAELASTARRRPPSSR